MSYVFYNAGWLSTTFEIGDISSWDTKNVTTMRMMFCYAGGKADYSLDLSGWVVDKVTDYSLFNEGSSTKVIAPTWVN